MLRFLLNRETGAHAPVALVRAEQTRRAFSLDLSASTEIERKHKSGVNSLSIDTVENRYLLSAGSDSSIYIYDLDAPIDAITHRVVRLCGITKYASADLNSDAHQFSVECVCWYPFDTGMFITSSMDNHVKAWDANTLQCACDFDFRSQVYGHAMSPIATSHSLIACALNDPKMRLCDLRSGSLTHTLRGHSEAVKAVAWSPRSEFVLATGGQDQRVLLWDVRQAAGPICGLDQHNVARARSASGGFGGGVDERGMGGPKAASEVGQSGGRREVLSVSTATAHTAGVNGLTFSADGLWLLSSGNDKSVRLWDALSCHNTMVNYGHINNTSKKRVQFCTSDSECAPNMVFHPHGNDIRVLNMHSGETLSVLKGHYKRVNACVFNPLTQDLISGAQDCEVLVWSPKAAAHAPDPQESAEFLHSAEARAEVERLEALYEPDGSTVDGRRVRRRRVGPHDDTARARVAAVDQAILLAQQDEWSDSDPE